MRASIAGQLLQNESQGIKNEMSNYFIQGEERKPWDQYRERLNVRRGGEIKKVVCIV